MYDLTNIFEVFLPQLLTYPNPTDPLNGEAAALQMREPERYRQKVIEYVRKFAKPEYFPSSTSKNSDEEGDDDDGSGFSMSDSENENDSGLVDEVGDSGFPGLIDEGGPSSGPAGPSAGNSFECSGKFNGYGGDSRNR